MRELLLSPPADLSAGPDRDVFLWTSARYARNLEGTAFPRRSSREESSDTRRRVLEALLDGPASDRPFSLLTEDAPAALSAACAERGYHDPEEADDPNALHSRALVLGRDGRESCFVNGIDHLRLRVLSPGFSVRDAFGRLRARELELDARLRFAASFEYGYLCSRPEDTGSGLRLGACVFLPGIMAAGVFDRVARDLSAGGIEPRVRHAESGEGAEGATSPSAYGSPLVELSARAPLGSDEDGFVARFADALLGLADGERRTRERVLSRERGSFEDGAFRAAAVLRAARRLPSEESSRLLLALRAGIVLGAAPPAAGDADQLAAADALLLLALPGHMRLRAGENGAGSDEERRAELVRGLLPRYLI